MGRLFHYLRRHATWPAAIALVLLYSFLSQGFVVRQSLLGDANPVLDKRGWYTPAQVKAFLEAIGLRGRIGYAASEWTLDLAFVAVFALLQGILLAKLWPPRHAWVLLVPLTAALLDLAENAFIAVLALGYDGSESSLATPAAWCTLLKMVAYLVLAPVVLIAGLACHWRGGSEDSLSREENRPKETTSEENRHESGR